MANRLCANGDRAAASRFRKSAVPDDNTAQPGRNFMRAVFVVVSV
jgi:hypothetical protein